MTMQQGQARSSRTALGLMLITPFFAALILLSTFKGDTFESIVVFFIIGIMSLFVANLARTSGFSPFKWLTGRFNIHDLKYIGLGLVALLALVFGITAVIPGTWGILIALGAGGLVLSYCLLKSESIVVPWLIHGLYNIIVIALASGLGSSIGLTAIQLNQSAIFVPSFGFATNLDTFAQLGMLQFFATALSEEALRISLALGVGVLFTSNKVVMFAVSTGLWSALHNIISFR